jgi:DNA-binding LytR/AlgR family response regulator
MESVYRCLIVDDEKPAHDVINVHISHTKGLLFVASAFNGKEAIDLLQHGDIDIIFLDIEMPLVNGMELLQALNPKPAVIITTAFHEFAFDAWQHDAVDYLKKPISYVKFAKAVNKAVMYCSQKAKPQLRHSFTFKINGDSRNVEIQNITYLASYGNYIKIFDYTCKQPLVVYETLANLQSELNKSNFVQIHRSFIVNRSFISKIEKEAVILKTGERLAVGRKYKVLLED